MELASKIWPWILWLDGFRIIFPRLLLRIYKAGFILNSRNSAQDMFQHFFSTELLEKLALLSKATMDSHSWISSQRNTKKRKKKPENYQINNLERVSFFSSGVNNCRNLFFVSHKRNLIWKDGDNLWKKIKSGRVNRHKKNFIKWKKTFLKKVHQSSKAKIMKFTCI